MEGLWAVASVVAGMEAMMHLGAMVGGAGGLRVVPNDARVPTCARSSGGVARTCARALCECR